VLDGIQLLFIRFATLKASFSCFPISKHFAFIPKRAIRSAESESFVVDSYLYQPAYSVVIWL
jgi:hypothetical protein